MSPVADLLATPSVPGCNPEQERSATWLELFFDLIFVINVAGLTHHLVAHPGLHSLGQVAVLYVTMSFALPVGIWWFYFRLLDRAELRPRVGSGQLLTYLHLPMTFAVVVMAAAVEVSLSGFTAAQPDGDGVGLLAAARHIVGGDAGRREVGPDLPGVRLLFGGLALWLACFLALRVFVVGLRRLGAAGWATAGVVAALALGAVLLGAVRATELFIFAGSLLLALAAFGSLLKELHQRRTARKQRIVR